MIDTFIVIRWVQREPYDFPFIMIIRFDGEKIACVHTIFQKWKSLKQM